MIRSKAPVGFPQFLLIKVKRKRDEAMSREMAENGDSWPLNKIRSWVDKERAEPCGVCEKNWPASIKLFLNMIDR